VTSRFLPVTLTLTLLAPAAPRVLAQIQLQQRAPQTLPTDQDSDAVNEREGQLVHMLRKQLVEEQFDELDRTADQFRREKSRWVGGKWKLRTFYEALDAPHQTDKDTVEHLEHLRHWMTQRPESITARIALATSLTRWAWVARGNGLANTVTAEMAQLFHERINEAQIVLEGSRDMKTMCPQWYMEEMTVGLAQGWDANRMEEIFNRAVQFEPDFPYFYKQRANYLLPKWYGKPGDAVEFAKNAADHLGSDTGDMIYWEIATVIIKRGNGNLDPFVKAMDWQRIQRGYQMMRSQFGPNNGQQNQLAFMAYKFNDPAVAQQQFASINNDWSLGVWRDRNFFEKVRDWSTGHTSWP
jgi:hypothetical protein